MFYLFISFFFKFINNTQKSKYFVRRLANNLFSFKNKYYQCHFRLICKIPNNTVYYHYATFVNELVKFSKKIQIPSNQQ